MDRVATRLETALRVTADWQEAETTDALARRACGDLLSLIPGDGAGWNEIDGARGLRVLASPAEYFPAGHQRLAELLHENPLVAALPRSGGHAHTFSDFVGVRDYHGREIYADVYRPYGVEDQLGGVVSLEGNVLIAVAVNRSSRSFSDGDRRVMELLRLQFAAARRTVEGRVAARMRIAMLERGLAAEGHELVLLDRRGVVADSSGGAGALLESWFGGDVPAPGRYERGDDTLVVRRVRGEPTLLLLDERRAAADLERCRALGLTRREGQVVSLAARGLKNSEIAAELFLSRRTVQKHLEHAFTKLGAKNRTDAARRFIGPS